MFFLTEVNMYTVGDKVLDSQGYIFVVESIEEKDFGNGPENYLVLAPCFAYDFNAGFKKFVPESKADTALNCILTEDQAIALIDGLKNIKPFDEITPHERKNFFQSILVHSDRETVCRIIKTLVISKQTRLALHKSVSDYDQRLLKNLLNRLELELSISLNQPKEQVASVVEQNLGIAG